MNFVVPVALSLAFLSSAASAAVLVDQQSVISASPGYMLTASGIGHSPFLETSKFGQMQSITAGKTGVLKGVDLQLVRSSDHPEFPFSVSLVKGAPGVLGEIESIGTINFKKSIAPTREEATAGKLLYVDLSSFNFAIEAGQQFSILLFISPSDISDLNSRIDAPAWVFGAATEDYSDEQSIEYQGGFNVLIMSDGSRIETGADRGFRTYVETGGVPEPATWAMLITGFGLVGAAARRRKVATAA